MAISKAPGGVEDLTLGMGDEQQIRRGQVVTITQVNADNIPYSDTESTKGKLDNVDSKAIALRNDLDNHKNDFNNPHKVTPEDIDGAWREHTHTIDDVTGLPNELDDLQNQIDTHDHDDKYFRETEHLIVGTGSSGAGRPIVLNADGKVDESLLDVAVFYYQGTWLPTLAIEYPTLVPGVTPKGALWLIEGLGDGVIYTFVTGDLIGSDVLDGSLMIWGENGWSTIYGDPQSKTYYALDGTRAITADFAGGGKKVTNIIDGVALTDGATVGQIDTKIDASIGIGNYSTRR